MLRWFHTVRSEERRHTLVAFLVLFGVMAGHALLETARDALFLARIPAVRLPWVYLGIAAVSLLLSRLNALRVSSRWLLVGWLLFASAVTLGFWYFVQGGEISALYALYIWSGVLVTLVLAWFWTLVGGLFTVTQAKRLYTVIGAGSVSGAIVGSGLAGLLTYRLPAADLLLVAAGFFGVSALVPLFLTEGAVGWTEALEPQGRCPAVCKLQGSRYGWWVGIMVVVSTVALTLGDFIFKATVAEIVAPEALAQWFSLFYLGVNLISLLVQVAVVGRVVQAVSVTGALLVLPALLGLGAIGVAAGGGLLAVVLLKGADGSLKHSLHRTAVELLFVPMSASLRRSTKTFIDVIGQRGGQAVGSLLILGVVALTSTEGTRSVLAWALLPLLVAWAASAVALKRHYLDIFRTTLQDVALEKRLAFPALDINSLESMIAALSSTHDAEVMVAMDMLVEQGRLNLVPALVLYHPADEVVCRALELFVEADRADFLPIVERILAGSPTTAVQAAALSSIFMMRPEVERMEKALNCDCAVGQAAGLVGLLAAGAIDLEVAEGWALRLASGEMPEARAQFASVIRHQPHPVLRPALAQLAVDPDPAVRLEAVQAMTSAPSAQCIPALLPLLKDRRLRPHAREALVTLGDAGLHAVIDALSNLSLDPRLRRHLPRTVSRFGTQVAVDALLGRLGEEPSDIVQRKVLRALNQLHDEHPELHFSRTVLVAGVRKHLARAFMVLDARTTLSGAADAGAHLRTREHALIVEYLEDLERSAQLQVFRLLSLLYPKEDFRRIHRGLRSPDPAKRASSRELVEHVVDPPLRAAVRALIDDAPAELRLAGAHAVYQPMKLGYEGFVRAVLAGCNSPLLLELAERQLHRLVSPVAPMVESVVPVSTRRARPMKLVPVMP